ncbi:hypothetical protein BV898_01379 [Hypsibius exemplaris]|uniref:G-protein coupled receptors family 1 profile domain-containing protein n=1 Tax=Hypsibius exemplaris TaxID=2072580 RepID=A0A1W0XBA3_HYPEX|nr:hypothetical protein BV898_01379 [Hypsibius exemplaris]
MAGNSTGLLWNDHSWNNTSNVATSKLANTTGNATLPIRPPIPLFRVIAAYGCWVLVAAALLLDLLIVVASLRRPSLRKPFNVHFLILFVEDIVCALLIEPLVMMFNLFPTALDFTSRASCAYSKYAQWTVGSWMLLQHVVICFDRWAALLWPNWYRTRTVTWSVGAALLSITFQQLLYLPLFWTDFLIERPAGTECRYTISNGRYLAFVRLVTMWVPQGILFISYPVLMALIWWRRRKRRIAQEQSRAAHVIAVAVPHNHKGRHSEAAPSTGEHARLAAAATVRTAKKQSHGQWQLVLWFVCLQLLCWMPTAVFAFIITSLGNRVTANLLEMHEVWSLLSGLLFLADPLIYLLFQKEVRVAVAAQARCN